MTDVPPPPPGFTLVNDVPPPPPGFTLVDDARPSRLAQAARFVDNVVRQTARGATLGFADEIAASARSGSIGGLTPNFWGDYGAAVAEERARDREFDQSNPITSLAAQFAGGVASPVARLAPGGAAASLPQAVLRGAATGAAVGGATGFGEGEGGTANRLVNAGQTALLGGALGGVIPLATTAGTAIGRRIGRSLGITSPQANAERMVLRNMERDAVPPGDVAANLRQPGPVAMVDAAGENVRGMGAFVARQPGTGRQAAMDMVAQRGGQAQRERLATAVRGNVSADDFMEEVSAVIQRRKAQARPAYDEAYAVTLPRDLRVQRFLQDPDIQRGIRAGIESARREAVTEDTAFNIADLGVRLTRDGGIQMVGGGTPTRLFDAAKRGLDGMIEAARNAGEGSRVRELSALRNAMLREVDRLNPAFARARAQFAGESELLDASTLGREMLSLRPAEWAERLADVRAMAPQQREMLRLGLARDMLDRIAATNDPQELTRINRILGSDQARERIRATFDNVTDFGRFMREFAREAEIARTNQIVNPRAGSQTQPLQEIARDMAVPPPGPVGTAFVRSDPNAPPGPLQTLTMPNGGFLPALRAAGQSLDQGAVYRDREAAARMLFNTDPAERVRLAEALIARAQRDAALRESLRPLLEGAARGGIVATGTD